jgi:hypothetical protein
MLKTVSTLGGNTVGSLATYAQYASAVSQSNGGATVANVVTFDTVVSNANISLVSGSRITFAATGVYALAYDLVFTNSSGANSPVNTWLTQNGAIIPNSGQSVYFLGGAGAIQSIGGYWIINATANDYIQLYWNAAATISMLGQASQINPTRPADPAASITIW